MQRSNKMYSIDFCYELQALTVKFTVEEGLIDVCQ